MSLYNYKIINDRFMKKILLLSPFIIMIYATCVGINYNMMDRYYFYNRLNIYDMYYFIINDSLIELVINIPILLVFLMSVMNSEDCFLLSRFRSRRRYAGYKIKELVYINVVICLLFTMTIYITSFILTKEINFNLYEYRNPISIVFNEGKKFFTNFRLNGITFIIINFYMLFFRNLIISVLILTLSKYVNLVFSFVVVIFPFLMSAWINGRLIHFFILDAKDINFISHLLIKIVFITSLYVFLERLYYYLQEKVM